MRRRMLVSVATFAVAGLGVTACSGSGGHAAVGTRDGVHLAGSTGTLGGGTAGCSDSATVTASATGTSSAAPDTLSLSLGISNDAKTASAALSTNDAKTRELIAAIVKLGVPATGIATTQLDVSANYNNKQVLTGYTVTDGISVQTDKTNLASRIIDAAASVGGNDVQFNGIDFSLSNDQAPAVAARDAAVTMAEARARSMAGAAGVTLGPICSINDDASPDPVALEGNSGSESASGAVTAPASPTGNSAPIESGSSQIVATVTVVYEALPQSGTAAT